MPIDRGSGGSDHPPDDDAQRPRDNRPLDFTRPAYRPLPYRLPEPRELYDELFGESEDSSGAGDQPAEADEATEKPSVGRHADHADDPEAARPEKPASSVDLPPHQLAEQQRTQDLPDSQPDHILPAAREDRSTTTAAKPIEAPDQREQDRPAEVTEPQDLGKGIRSWWEVDPAEPEDNAPDRPTSPYAGSREHHPDQPAEPGEIAQQAPTAATNLGQSQPSTRIEQPEPSQLDRPQTLDERKAAYWAERGGETRHFPGWSGPADSSSESQDSDQPSEPRVSFVWGKVVYHDRDDASSEARSEDAESSSEERPDAAAPAEGADTRAEVTGGWDRSENPYSPLGGTRAAFNPEHTPEERQAASAEGVARTTDVLGRKPINASYAGRVFYDSWTDELKAAYPDGVQFSYEAFPEFARYATAIVQLDEGFGPTRKADERRARRAWHDQTGEVLDEAGYTWHHHEDGRTLLLVPTDVHDATRHHGGWAISQRLGTRRTDDA
ncbi:HNH endonuclease signature motif containing protein [Flindersiella endophytica]